MARFASLISLAKLNPPLNRALYVHGGRVVIFFLTFSCMFVVNLIVISKLKRNHPQVLDLADNPTGLMSNTVNASFTFGFIGLRLYRHKKLNLKIKRWCDILCVLVWLFLLNFTHAFYVLLQSKL